jgi:hypothetical protein
MRDQLVYSQLVYRLQPASGAVNAFITMRGSLKAAHQPAA